MFPLAQYGDEMRDDRLELAARQRLTASLRKRRTDRSRRIFLRRLLAGLGAVTSSHARPGTTEQ